MIKHLLLAGLALAAATPIFGQAATARMHPNSGPADTNYRSGSGSFGQPSARSLAFSRLRSTLRALRAEALALRAADGGTLTPEHDALIQARLDRAHAAYRRYRTSPW